MTLPGLNITVVPGQIGYPRDVVPGAELVKTVSSDEGTQLPHWADPPTGEVPRALAGAPGDDDLQGWRLLGSKGLRWREDMSDWSDGPGVEDLVDQDEGQANRMDAPASNPFSFDEDFERLERQRAERASSDADATVEIVGAADAGAGGASAAAAGAAGAGAGDAGAGVAGPGPGVSREAGGTAAPRPGDGPGDGSSSSEVGAPWPAMPPLETTGGETVAGAGALPLFVEPVGEAKGPAGTAAAERGGRPVGGTGGGAGPQAAGLTGPSPSGGEGDMADRTATRTPGRGQLGLGRAGRGPAPRRAAEAEAKSAAAPSRPGSLRRGCRSRGAGP